MKGGTGMFRLFLFCSSFPQTPLLFAFLKKTKQTFEASCSYYSNQNDFIWIN